MSIPVLSRQGLRRLNALNPATGFHDSLHPLASVRKYPRALLDARREDPSRSLRKRVEKEQDMKRFSKMGVSRTRPHGIENIADCEYVGISDLAAAVSHASLVSAETGVNIDAVLEQVSERLMRDADLLPVSDLVAILAEFHANRYFNLSLINKVKNEALFDLNRTSVRDLCVLLHLMVNGWNVMSPKLITEVAKRVSDELVSEAATVQSADICVLVSALCRVPTKTLRTRTVTDCLGAAVSYLVKSHASIDTPSLAAVLRDIVNLEFQRGVSLGAATDELTTVVMARDVTDVETGSRILWSVSRRKPDGVGDQLVKLADTMVGLVGPLADQFAEASQCSVDLERIWKRNKVVDIAARIVTSAHRLGIAAVVDAYLPMITEDTVRGLACHLLVELCEMNNRQLTSVLKDEVIRKRPSFSPRQRALLDQYLV